MWACLKVPQLVPAAIATALLCPLGIYAQAPTRVVARETAPGVITVTWSPVAGAAEYFIGRSVWPEGFRRAGTVKDTVYVDTAARAGVRHTYTVAIVGSAQRTRSNEVIPGGAGDAPIAGGPPRGPVGGRGASEPAVDAPVDSLLTPPPDTISTARCSAEANRKAQERRTAARRVGRDSVEMPSSDATTTEKTPAQRAYLEGKCLSPGSPGYPTLWYPVAERSGLTYEEQVRAWRHINLIALAYKHLLQREPTPEETRREIAALQRGKHWKNLWRQLAHSPERDERFGFFAPAPLASRAAARTAFGLSFDPTPEMCFGGLGPRCAGTVPDARVAPNWFGHFRLPDGTEMAYVALGVAVGSILHDNACLADQSGLNCSGLGAGDLWKHKDWPAALEWNKASWNVLDGRTWREAFGPYPTARALQDQFFDDLRPVPARVAYMAPILSMGTIPITTIPYAGKESKRTRALRAPPGTSLDDRDDAFCASGTFRERGSFPGKSGWGFCR
jgi:hypothetical protein